MVKRPHRLVMRYLAVAAGLAVSACALTSPAQAIAPAMSYSERGTEMTPRFQWNANSGYCGETAFISAGMHFGQYTSQWTARSLASPGVDQWKPSSQLLLGVNDLRAAKAMGLTAQRYDNAGQRSVQQFLRWVKGRFVAGSPVIIGVLNNTRILGEWPQDKGDAEYDHIVPVFGIGSGSPLSDRRYYATDAITISDNGLHNIGPNIPYLYTYEFASFPRTRDQANAIGGPVYALRDRPRNYGTEVTGVVDPQRVTVPVRLTSSVNGEGVQDGVGPNQVMKQPPPGTPMTLTARVTIPDQARAYVVYLYDDFGKVPTRDFNANAAQSIDSWTIPAGSGPSWSITIDALTSDTRVFRAVPVSAP